MQSPFGVILKRGRSAERGHKERLRRTSQAFRLGVLDLPGHRFEESILECAGAFGVLRVQRSE